MSGPSRDHSFTLLLTGVDVDDEVVLTRLRSAGEVPPVVDETGLVSLDVTRPADSFDAAVEATVHELQEVTPAQVVDVIRWAA